MARASAIVTDNLGVSRRGRRACLCIGEVNSGGGRGGTGLYG
jgi:hypothetical protein